MQFNFSVYVNFAVSLRHLRLARSGALCEPAWSPAGDLRNTCAQCGDAQWRTQHILMSELKHETSAGLYELHHHMRSPLAHPAPGPQPPVTPSGTACRCSRSGSSS